MVGRRIAITGATGFIGGALVRELAHAGHQIKVLVRPQSLAKTRNLPNDIDVILGNLDNEASIQEFLSDADSVIHCAGAVRGATEASFIRTNEKAVHDLVGAVVSEPKIDRFLLISSLAASQPDVSAYAASKKAGEDVLSGADLNCVSTVFRPPAVYGPGDTELLPLFKTMSRGFAPIWNSSEHRFSLIYISDLVSAVTAWVSSSRPPAGIFELCDGQPGGYSMDGVIKVAENVLRRRIRPITVPSVVLNILARSNVMLARLFHYEPMLTPWKLRELRYPRWVCDNSDIAEKLAWEPCVQLAEGLPLTLVER